MGDSIESEEDVLMDNLDELSEVDSDKEDISEEEGLGDDLLDFLTEPTTSPTTKKIGEGYTEDIIKQLEESSIKTKNIENPKKPVKVVPLKKTKSIPKKTKSYEGETIFDTLISKIDEFKLSEEEKPKEEPTLNLQNDILSAIRKHMKVSHITPSEKIKPEKPQYTSLEEPIRRMEKSHEVLEKGSDVYKKIEDLCISAGTLENVELEASFGTFNKNFFPGIKSLSSFKFVVDYLKSRSDNFKVEYSNDVVYMIEGYDVRKIEKEGTSIYEKKSRDTLSKIDIYYLGVRVSESQEVKLKKGQEFEDRWKKTLDEIKKYNPSKDNSKDVMTVLRHRNRISYIGTINKEYEGLRFDLTFVEEYRNFRDGSSNRIIKQELEIESTNLNPDKFIENILSITKVLQDSPNYLKCKKEEGMCKIISSYEIQNVIYSHNRLFEKEMRTKGWIIKDPFRLYEGYWNKPQNIKNYNLLKENLNDYNVTVKLDGVRKFILFDGLNIYMVGPPYDVTKIGTLDNDTLSGTLLDCEFIRKPLKSSIKTSVHVFDVLFYKYKDVRDKSFSKRFDIISSIKDSLPKENLFVNYFNKKFYSGNFYESVEYAFKEIVSLKINTDGLIFQSPGVYFNGETWKWKEVQNMTIDFLFVPLTKEEVEILKDETKIKDKFAFWLKVGSSNGNIIFKGTDKYPFSGAIFCDSDMLGDQQLHYKIVECSWDSENEEFIPVRIRNDRSKPNNISIARDDWMDIMKPMSIRTIMGQDLVAMRSFHNIVKSEMLNKEFGGGDVLLDVGSGRGGDLKKWEKFKRVYAVEPNDENIKELGERMKNMNIRNVTPLHMSIEETEKIREHLKKDGLRLDGIVSFFSMTYFTKNEEIYNNFLNTLKLLPTGGKFIGIVLDGDMVKEELDEIRNENETSEGDRVSINNSAFTIEQVSQFDETRFANIIKTTIYDESTMVKKQREYLFYFNLFVEDMKEIGYILEKEKFLDDGKFYEVLPENGKLFSKLNRQFVFKKTSTLLKINIDYKHNFVGILGSDVIQPFINPYSQKNLYYIGVESEASSFVHSILQATSKKYRSMNKQEKIDRVLEFRRELSTFLTKDLFLKMHRGEFSRRLYTPYMYEGKSKEESINIALLQFKQKLVTKDENIPLGEISLLEIVSLFLKKDVYILNLDENFFPSRLFGKECDMLYNFDKAIILIKADYIYYPVFKQIDDKNYYLFKSSEGIIEIIKKEVCLY